MAKLILVTRILIPLLALSFLAANAQSESLEDGRKEFAAYHYDAASVNLDRAIEQFEQKLKILPTDSETLRALAESCSIKGQIYFLRARYADATNSYHKSLDTLDRLLALSPSNFADRIARASLLDLLGKLQLTLSKYDEATATLEQALSSCRGDLLGHGQDPAVESVTAMTLADIASVKIMLGHYSEARKSLQESLAACGTNQQERVYTLSRFAQLHYKLSEREAFNSCVEDLIKSADSLLAQRPKDIDALRGKAGAYLLRAMYRAQDGQWELSRPDFEEAGSISGVIMTLDPDDIEAYSDKASDLCNVGLNLSINGAHKDALQMLQFARAACDHALKRAPDNIGVQSNRAFILYNTALVYSNLGDIPQEVNLHKEAIEGLNRVLETAPNDVRALKWKASALRSLANAQQHIKRVMAFDQIAPDVFFANYYPQAFEASDEALRVAPDNFDLVNNRAFLLYSYGRFLKREGETRKSIESFQEALKYYDKAAAISPKSAYLYREKGFALGDLGEMQASGDESAKAIETFHAAIEALDADIAVCPADAMAFCSRGKTCLALGERQFYASNFKDALMSFQKARDSFSRGITLNRYCEKVYGKYIGATDAWLEKDQLKKLQN